MCVLFTACSNPNPNPGADATRASTQAERINKLWSAHPVDYHSVLGRKDVLTQATT